jgi:hypothetical protein
MDTPFGRMTSLIVIKSRNLAHACYSLTLDSLAQEAGALFRPLLESLELLEFLRRDPSRVQQALDDRLPSAGKIAESIDGQFHGLRQHLNKHASHLSVGMESMRHLIRLHDKEPFVRFEFQQQFRFSVVLTNLQTLFATFALAATVAVNCAAVAGCPAQAILADRIETLRRRGLRVLGAADEGPGAR